MFGSLLISSHDNISLDDKSWCFLCKDTNYRLNKFSYFP